MTFVILPFEVASARVAAPGTPEQAALAIACMKIRGWDDEPCFRRPFFASAFGRQSFQRDTLVAASLWREFLR